MYVRKLIVTDPEEKRLLEADHVGKCKSNFKGSAASMETVGVKKHFFKEAKINIH